MSPHVVREVKSHDRGRAGQPLNHRACGRPADGIEDVQRVWQDARLLLQGANLEAQKDKVIKVQCSGSQPFRAEVTHTARPPAATLHSGAHSPAWALPVCIDSFSLSNKWPPSDWNGKGNIRKNVLCFLTSHLWSTFQFH